MQLEQMEIAVVGAGEMGGAIVCGLVAGGRVPAGNIRVSNPTRPKLEALERACPGVHITTSNKEAVRGAHLVVLAVKPRLVERVLGEMATDLLPDALVVSVAAGVPLEQLAGWAGEGRTVFRALPNIAVEVAAGVTAISCKNATDGQRALVTDLFASMGAAFVVPEERLDAYMSLASCGLAYAFRYIRAAMEGGVELGIPAAEAKQAVMATLEGAVALLRTHGSHPEAEVDRVTTPGGLTIRGLNAMEAHGFTSAVVAGLRSSLPR